MSMYEVRDPEIEALMKKIGRQVKDQMPIGWGFTLFIFGYGFNKPVFYISSAQREDMIVTLKQFIKGQEGVNKT